MSSLAASALLRDDDPPPVDFFNPGGGSSFLLLGDHAGKLIPGALGDLGLRAGEIERHIGWDIGVAQLGQLLALALDAPFISQRYSRLVVDCNRAPGRVDATPEVSDGTPIPANVDLSDEARAARTSAIQLPYQRAIGEELARRDAAGQRTILVALHSFTPAMGGTARPWHSGVLHDLGDARFAMAMLERLRGEPGLIVGDNEPYRMDVIDYTIPRHAYPERRPYLELEVRQDLVADLAGITEWCERLARLLPEALSDTNT